MPSLLSSSHLPSSQWQGLPTGPGVYLFKNATEKVIYIGKAKNLKQRVSSYFKPPTKLGYKTTLLVKNIVIIDHIRVNSEIEAFLLESKLIKKFKPKFNLISKDDKTPYYISLTKETFPKPIITHQSKNSLAGPFLNSLIPKKILKQFRHVAPYCTAPRLVNKPCFYSHIGLCYPCPGSTLTSSEISNYHLNIVRLRKLLNGQFTSVRRNLKSSMLTSSQKLDYESAARIRDQIEAIDQLKSRPISPDEFISNPNLISDINNQTLKSIKTSLIASGVSVTKLNRIEMYDNAHLSGTSATSAMVVATNGELDRNQYRHFKIKDKDSNSDTDMMFEVISRRLKNTRWKKPDLIVLDGGIPQISTVLKIDLPCPIIGLAKRDETIIIPMKENTYNYLTLPQNNAGLNLLKKLRDEAHRFSRRLHHKIRSKKTFL